MKNIIYYDPEPKLNQLTSIESYHKEKLCLFKKFFPKYLKHLSLASKDHIVRFKVKRTKIINSLQEKKRLFYNRSDWRVLLSNKMKTVKALSNTSQSDSQFIQKIKLFSGLKSIQLSEPKQDQDWSQIISKMSRLKKLRCLNIDGLTKEGKSLMHKLNSSPKLLKSFKSLNLSCQWEYSNETELLENLRNNQNLLRNLTSLRLGILCSPKHQEDFQALTNFCPNLQRLSIGISDKAIIYVPSRIRESRFNQTSFSVEANYLSAIKSFQNLQSLEINIADTVTFLKDFCLPPLVQHLQLNFQEFLSKKILQKIDQNFSDIQAFKFFEKNKTFLKFYDQFQHLHHLETLEIRYNSYVDQDSYKYHNFLAQLILKSISSPWKKFTFLTCESLRDLNQNRDPCLPIADCYLPDLFSALCPTIQVLEIGHERIMYSKFNLSLCQNKFQNLSSIKITGEFDQDVSSNVKISTLFPQILSLGNSITMIKLNIRINPRIRALTSLLKELKSFYRSKKLHIELQVKFMGLNELEDSQASFEDAISELNKGQKGWMKLQRVSLQIFTDMNTGSQKEFFEVYSRNFEKFQICSKYSNFS